MVKTKLKKMAKLLRYSLNIQDLVEKSLEEGTIDPRLEQELKKDFEKEGEEWAKDVIRYADWETEVRESYGLEGLEPPYDPRDIEDIIFDEVIPGIKEHAEQFADWAYSPYHNFKVFLEMLGLEDLYRENPKLENEFSFLFDELQDSFDDGAYKVFEREIPRIARDLARKL